MADRAGVPALARISQPQTQPMTIKKIIDTYTAHNGAKLKAKQEATKPLQRLVEHVGATKLDDLTTVKLLAWKAAIEETVPGPATRRAYYSRVRTVVAFGMKAGLDSTPIREFLDRAKVLKCWR